MFEYHATAEPLAPQAFLRHPNPSTPSVADALAKLATCYHEAGHAVMITAHELLVIGISIEKREGNWCGGVLYFPLLSEPVNDREFYKMLVAGDLAEQIFTPNVRQPGRYNPELDQASELADAISINEDVHLGDLIAELNAEAAAVLVENASVMHAIATDLRKYPAIDWHVLSHLEGVVRVAPGKNNTAPTA